MKKKGFTLIELLAVIVVLAIIALIATPIVMNTIKNSKKGAIERAADNYVKEVEISLMEYRLETGENLPDGEYEIDSETGHIVGNGKTLKVEMNGTKPNGGKVTITNGQVSTTGTSMSFGDYTVSYDETNKTFVASEAGSNVEVLCKANIEKVNSLVWNRNTSPYEVTSYTSEEVGLLASESGAYTIGVTYTCDVGDGEEKIFYVLEENDDTVSLLMNMNIDSNGKGTTEGIRVEKTMILEYLKSSTKSWSNLKESQISLPSAEQIAVASGKSFDGKNIVRNLLNWLYVENSTAPSGYWTSTSVGSSRNWNVDGIDGIISDGSEGLCNYIGVRPVITISKSQLG